MQERYGTPGAPILTQRSLSTDSSNSAIPESGGSNPAVERTTLVVAGSIPEDGEGRYLHYRNLRVGGAGWRRVDVGPIVHMRQDEWLDDVDRWHRELSRRGTALTSWWWLIAGSRITAWYPLDLRSLFVALGVIELCETGQEPSPLYLVAFPAEALSYIEEWAAANPARVDVKRMQTATAESPGDRAPQPRWWRATARLWVGVLARWLSRETGNASAGKVDTVVISYALSAELMREVGDHFFGRLFEAPDSKPAGAVEWFYMLSSFRDRKAVRAECSAMGRRMAYDFDWLRWQDLAGILWDAVAIRRQIGRLSRELPRLEVGRLHSKAFPQRFADAAIYRSAPVAELAFYRAFKRYLGVAKPARVVYPYEEKGIERAILQACAQGQTIPLTAAFGHAVYSQGHLYVRKQNDLGRPHPTVIATTGPAMREWMARWGNLPDESLVTAGTPRFAARDPNRRSAASLKALFIASYGYEIGQLATMAQELPGLFNDIDLMIRRYRHDWHAEQKEGLSTLERLGVNLRADEGSLAEQIEWADVVLFSSTSAGIEAVLRGRVSIRIVGDIFDADPMYQRDPEKQIPACVSALEVKPWLSEIAAMDAWTYDRLVDRQHQVASSIYAPVAPSIWRAALQPSPSFFP